MPIEIHEPELERRVRWQIQNGHYHDVDELLAAALDALDERVAPPSAAESRNEAMGVDLVLALQSSPYRELEIEPPRFREPMPVRDIVL